MLRTSIEELPVSITASDTELSCETDFRVWVRVSLIIEDKQIPDEAKLPIICQYIGLDLRHFEGTAEDLWTGIFSFYNAEAEPKGTDASPSKGIAYKFDYDWWLIYAAFQQQYHINLLKANLHWFEFKALLDGLGEDTLFISVVQARLKDTSKLKGEEKAQAEKAKRYWKVPEEDDVNERDPHEIEAELLARIKE